jgi:hypothetical protein
MQEVRCRLGYQLAPPDDDAVVTTADYWRAVLVVALNRFRKPDRAIAFTYEEELIRGNWRR